MINIIAAVSENGVIGKKGEIPWHLRTDFQNFNKTTSNHHILMGLNTFQDIARMQQNWGKPNLTLQDGRTSIVLTNDIDYSFPPEVIPVYSLEEAIKTCQDKDVFIIGGGSIYRQFIDLADKLYITRVHTMVNFGDVFFPEIDLKKWKLESSTFQAKAEKDDFDMDFQVYTM